MKNKKGFTLIEVLVTIAIIGLLASIIFASVSTAREKAKKTEAVSQGKEIDKAVELSRLSNGFLPFSNTDPSVSIKDDNSILSAIQETFPTIANMSLPSGDMFDSGEYYVFTNGSRAVMEIDGLNYPATCRDEIPEDIIKNESSQEYQDIVNSWEADDAIVGYKTYSECTGRTGEFVGTWPNGSFEWTDENQCIQTLESANSAFVNQGLKTVYVYYKEGYPEDPEWVVYPPKGSEVDGVNKWNFWRCI